MSTSTVVSAAAQVDVADLGPRTTLRVLRIFAVLHSLCAIVQPMLAGVYLSGEVDALDVHALNGHITSVLGLAQLVAAIVYVWRGRGRTWPLYSAIGIVVAEQAQTATGFEGVVAIHIPLGVSIISMQILLTVWLFRASARSTRPGKGLAQ